MVEAEEGEGVADLVEAFDGEGRDEEFFGGEGGEGGGAVDVGGGEVGGVGGGKAVENVELGEG